MMRDRAKSSRRSGGSSVAELQLVCCAIVDRRLSYLVRTTQPRELPHAPLRAGEEPEDAAKRAATQLLGAAPTWLRQATTTSRAGTPPLAIAYLVIAPAEQPAPEGMTWVRFAATSRFAPRDAAAFARAVRTLEERLDVEPIAFRLLPPAFTLSELQLLYETLLGRRLHKASFRRTLLAGAVVAPTDAWRREGRGRPAQLYRYAPGKARGRAAMRALRFDLLR